MRYLSVAVVMAVLVGACTVDQDLGVGGTATTARSGTTSPTAAELNAAKARIKELERTVDRLRDENQDLKDAVARLESALNAGTGEDSTSEPIGSCPQLEAEPGEAETVVLVYMTCVPMTSDTDRVLAGLVPVRRVVADDEEVLAAALRALLSGITTREAEVGYSSWFSSATAGALLSVVIDSQAAVVDLDADAMASLNNVSTSTGGTYFRGQLYGTVFANAAVDSVELRLDGDPAGFCGLMELVPDCTPITRGEWNQNYTQAFEN